MLDQLEFETLAYPIDYLALLKIAAKNNDVKLFKTIFTSPHGEDFQPERLVSALNCKHNVDKFILVIFEANPKIGPLLPLITFPFVLARILKKLEKFSEYPEYLIPLISSCKKRELKLGQVVFEHAYRIGRIDEFLQEAIGIDFVALVKWVYTKIPIPFAQYCPKITSVEMFKLSKLPCRLEYYPQSPAVMEYIIQNCQHMMTKTSRTRPSAFCSMAHQYLAGITYEHQVSAETLNILKLYLPPSLLLFRAAIMTYDPTADPIIEQYLAKLDPQKIEKTLYDVGASVHHWLLALRTPGVTYESVRVGLTRAAKMRPTPQILARLNPQDLGRVLRTRNFKAGCFKWIVNNRPTYKLKGRDFLLIQELLAHASPDYIRANMLQYGINKYAAWAAYLYWCPLPTPAADDLNRIMVGMGMLVKHCAKILEMGVKKRMLVSAIPKWTIQALSNEEVSSLIYVAVQYKNIWALSGIGKKHLGLIINACCKIGGVFAARVMCII